MIEGSMSMIAGLKIISSPHLPRFKVVQFRFPKTKKPRIQKKWRKDSRNWRQIPCHAMYRMGDTVIVHPDDLARIRATVAEEQCRVAMRLDRSILLPPSPALFCPSV